MEADKLERANLKSLKPGRLADLQPYFTAWDGEMLQMEPAIRLSILVCAAEAEGAEVLAADRLSVGHTPCAKHPWSAGPQPTGPAANAPWHPNMAGHAALAEALARQVGLR